MNKLTPRLMPEIAKKIIHEYQNWRTDTNELHIKFKIPLRTIQIYRTPPTRRPNCGKINAVF